MIDFLDVSNLTEEEMEKELKYIESILPKDPHKFTEYLPHSFTLLFSLTRFIKKHKEKETEKKEGKYIYCVVGRALNCPVIGKIAKFLEGFHAGIFEVKTFSMIDYGAEDANKVRRPLSIRSLNAFEIDKYWIEKYFQSDMPPEKFIKTIDNSFWTAERFQTFNHNCIMCVN